MKAVKVVIDGKHYKGKLANNNIDGDFQEVILFRANGDTSRWLIHYNIITECNDNCEKCEKRWVCYTE